MDPGSYWSPSPAAQLHPAPAILGWTQPPLPLLPSPLQEADFTRVADLLHRTVIIAKDCLSKLPAGSKLKDFKEYVEKEGRGRSDVHALKEEVEVWASTFPMPGL